MSKRLPVTAAHIRDLAAALGDSVALVRHPDGGLEVIPQTYRVIVRSGQLEERWLKCREPERQAELVNEHENYLIEEERDV